MKTLHSLSIAAALGFAGTVYAQDQPTPQSSTDTTAPTAASSPHQRDTTSTTSPESDASSSAQPGAASSQHQRDTVGATRVAEAGGNVGMSGQDAQKLVGMKVEGASGERIGEVKEVVLDEKGAAAYAVISHGNKRTAVPWSTVNSMLQDDKLVMQRSQLEQAPAILGDKTPEASGSTWKREADEYWQSKSSTQTDYQNE